VTSNNTNTPGNNPHTINDLVPAVIEALQNKQNITPQQCASWLHTAILNVTENYQFEELRRVGPLVTIGPGLGFQGSNWMYLISSFLNTGDDYTLTDDPVIVLASTSQGTFFTSPGQITNAVTYPMDYMTRKAIQPLLGIGGGIPFKYTRDGAFFWFGTQPGQPYQVYLPYQVRHPFNEGDMLSSQLYFPTSWEMVMAFTAALIGAHANRWPDMVKNLRDIIYGDPKGQGEPGILKALTSQITRDESKSTRQIIPYVGRY
jgi:hypothetical protein